LKAARLNYSSPSTTVALETGNGHLPTRLSLLQLQKYLEQYQKIPKSVVVQHIGVAGKFLGVRRIFARILPNLPEKNSIKKGPPKTSSVFYFGGHSCSYFQEFAKINDIALYVISQIFSNFVKVFKDFAQISTDFRGFARFFTKTCWGALPLSACTSGAARDRSAMINVKNRTNMIYKIN